jgi:hypothetical protein
VDTVLRMTQLSGLFIGRGKRASTTLGFSPMYLHPQSNQQGSLQRTFPFSMPIRHVVIQLDEAAWM